VASYYFSCPHGVSIVNAPMSEGPGGAPDCPVCMEKMRRAYSLEGVGFAVSQLRQHREMGVETTRDAARLFLETAEEAAGPGDPDGAKAIDEWNERMTPAAGNKNPVRPERPLHSKKVF